MISSLGTEIKNSLSTHFLFGISYLTNSERLSIICFRLASFSSSDIVGSFMKRAHGKSGQLPQFTTAFPDRTYRITCVLSPKHPAFNISASFTFFWKRRTIYTSGSTWRRIKIIIFPVPPFTLIHIRILRVNIIFQCTVQIELTTIYRTPP